MNMIVRKLGAFFAALLFAANAWALDASQTATLKAAALADPAVAACNAVGDDACIAAWFNAPTAFVVWRTLVDEDEYTDDTSAEATTWSWTTFISRSVGERDGWARMMRNGNINPSKANVRAAIADIFSGTAAQAVNQRNHLLAMSKRNAIRCEQLLATGAGTNASPGNLTHEGTISPALAGQILRN